MPTTLYAAVAAAKPEGSLLLLDAYRAGVPEALRTGKVDVQMIVVHAANMDSPPS